MDTLEKRLWDAADQLRANPGQKSQAHSATVLGLIFLRSAQVCFAAQRAKLGKVSPCTCRGSRIGEPAAYHAEARLDYLLNRSEAENIGAKVNAVMRDLEKLKPQIAGVLPKTYNLFTSILLKELLNKASEIPASMGYDAFGRILDPAYGSGATFVSSAWFVAEHKKSPAAEISVHGVEKTEQVHPESLFLAGKVYRDSGENTCSVWTAVASVARHRFGFARSALQKHVAYPSPPSQLCRKPKRRRRLRSAGALHIKSNSMASMMPNSNFSANTRPNFPEEPIFVQKERTADYQTTSGLLRLIENKANRDDILAFFQERKLPLDEVEAESLTDEVLRTPPEVGYLTVLNALQWRLQYGRVIEQAGKIGGILRLV